MKRDQYTAGPARPCEPNAWKVTRNGDVLGYYDTQHDAVRTAMTLCNDRWARHRQTAELRIKGRDGKVRYSRTYGRDPRGTKG